MRLLVDNALSPEFAVVLSGMGHDAIHVRDIDLAHASDSEIFEFAAEHARVVVSADTDFGTLLALRNEQKPSVVLWRRQSPRRAVEQAAVMRGALTLAEIELREGAIVVIEVARLRIRRLPIGGH